MCGSANATIVKCLATEGGLLLSIRAASPGTHHQTLGPASSPGPKKRVSRCCRYSTQAPVCRSNFHQNLLFILNCFSGHSDFKTGGRCCSLIIGRNLAIFRSIRTPSTFPNMSIPSTCIERPGTRKKIARAQIVGHRSLEQTVRGLRQRQ